MPALTTVAEYQTSAKQRIIYRKPASSWGGSGIGWYSNVRIAGDPAAATAPANNTAGTFAASPGTGYPTINAGDRLFITGVEASILSSNTTYGGFRYFIADLLWHAGTYTGSSNVTLSSQPSFATRLPSASYSGLLLMYEGIGGSTSPTNLTVTYTNQAGTTGRSTGAIDVNPSSSSNVGLQAGIFPLQAGDDGIQKVESVVGSGGGAYTVNLLIVRPLARGRVDVRRVGGVRRKWLDLVTPIEIYPTSALVTFANTEGAPNVLFTAPMELAIEVATPSPATAPTVHPGTLVVEVLYESVNTAANPDETPNTGSLNGVFKVSGSGIPATVQSAGGAVNSGGYLKCANVFDGGFVCFCAWTDNTSTQALHPGTADFEFSMYARFRLVTNRWGYVFWGWQTGTLQPCLAVESGTGRLLFNDNVVSYFTGFVQPTDNVWRKYSLIRLSGVAYVYVDDVLQFSVAYTSNVTTASTVETFEIGCYGNGAAGFSDADIDEFRFYNGNV